MKRKQVKMHSLVMLFMRYYRTFRARAIIYAKLEQVSILGS